MCVCVCVCVYASVCVCVCFCVCVYILVDKEHVTTYLLQVPRTVTNRESILSAHLSAFVCVFVFIGCRNPLLTCLAGLFPQMSH